MVSKKTVIRDEKNIVEAAVVAVGGNLQPGGGMHPPNPS
jgi:hypothetical protein